MKIGDKVILKPLAEVDGAEHPGVESDMHINFGTEVIVKEMYSDCFYIENDNDIWLYNLSWIV